MLGQFAASNSRIPQRHISISADDVGVGLHASKACDPAAPVDHAGVVRAPEIKRRVKFSYTIGFY